MIKAMKVVSAEKHPNADRLRVYSVENETGEARVIVANLTNVYEVGDVAAVAEIGSVVDGVEIKATNLRGVDSFGMMLGKVDAPVGTDVSDKFVNA